MSSTYELHPAFKGRIKKMRNDLRTKVKVQGMKARMIVLHDMLIIEGMIKMMFGPYLGIKKEKLDPTRPKHNKKKTIKDQGIPVKFDQMLKLLVHLDVIDAESEYPKLHLFYLIRCQFVHNYKADSFVRCFEILGKDRKTELFKLHPPKGPWKEERQLELSVRALGKQCRDIAGNVVDAFFEKALFHAESEQNKNKYEYTAIRNATMIGLKELREALAIMVKEGHKLDEQDVELLPRWLHTVLDEHFHREFKALFNKDKKGE